MRRGLLQRGQHLTVEGDWVAALVQGTSTPFGNLPGASCRLAARSTVQEMEFYRVVGGKLVECR
jgi:hypothetical protein